MPPSFHVARPPAIPREAAAASVAWAVIAASTGGKECPSSARVMLRAIAPADGET